MRTFDFETEFPQILMNLQARFDTQRIMSYLKPLNENDPPKEEDWYINIFVGILHETWRATRHMFSGLRLGEMTYLSWAARNALELQVWTKYVIASRTNARRFHEDKFVDGTEVIALTDDLHLIDKRAEIYREAFDEMKATIAEFMTHQGIDAKGKKHLNVGSVAQQVEFGPEFQAMNRLFSKLVHPTAYSILTPLGNEREIIMKSTFYSASCYCHDILHDVNAHFQAIGIQPYD